jgi:hypothetical protein
VARVIAHHADGREATEGFATRLRAKQAWSRYLVAGWNAELVRHDDGHRRPNYKAN